MLKLYLNDETFCIIDDADAIRVLKYKWHLHQEKGNLQYVRTNIGGFKVNLGRFLLNLGNSPKTCDHINGQTLDYRRVNLRAISLEKNLKAANRRRKRGVKIPTLEEILNYDNFDVPFLGEECPCEVCTSQDSPSPLPPQ